MGLSLVIQQGLFFQPVQEVSSTIPFDQTDKHFGDHDSEIIYNPLLVEKFGPVCLDSVMLASILGQSAGQIVSTSSPGLLGLLPMRKLMTGMNYRAKRNWTQK